MKQTTIKKVKLGEFFRLENSENSPLWKRSEYCQPYKKYVCYQKEDVSCFLMLESSKIVFI
jgi:hypothetical protein